MENEKKKLVQVQPTKPEFLHRISVLACGVLIWLT